MIWWCAKIWFYFCRDYFLISKNILKGWQCFELACKLLLWICKFKSRWSFLFEHIVKDARLLFVFQLWGHLFSHSCQADLLLRSSVCGWCFHLISPQLLHIQQDPGNKLQSIFVGKTSLWHLILMCGLMWELSWEKIFSVCVMLSFFDNPASLSNINLLSLLPIQCAKFRAVTDIWDDLPSAEHIQPFLSNSFPCSRIVWFIWKCGSVYVHNAFSGTLSGTSPLFAYCSWPSLEAAF